MDSRGLDRNMASRSAREMYGSVADSQEKLPSGRQTARNVDIKLEAIRVLRQTASTPNTPRRAAADYAVAASVPESSRKTEKAEESEELFEIKECQYKPRAKVRKAVETALGLLRRERESCELGSWQFAMLRLKAMHGVMNGCGLDDRKSNDCKFVVHQLGPHCANALRTAFSVLNELQTNGHGWEYHNDFVHVMSYFCLQQDQDSLTRANGESALRFAMGSFRCDLSYLGSIKDFSVRCDALKKVARNKVYNNMLTPYRQLVNQQEVFRNNIPEEKLKFARDEVRKFIQPHNKNNNIIRGIESNASNGTTDKAIDELEKLTGCVFDGKHEMWVRRLYGDLLLARVEELGTSGNMAKSVQEYLPLIKEMKEIYSKADPLVKQFRALSGNLKLPIANIVKKMVSEGTERFVLLKKECLDFIDGLIADGMLSKESIKLYLRYKEMYTPLQVELEAADQAEEMTMDQYNKEIDDILKFVKDENLEDCLKAADMLKQLLYKRGGAIRNCGDGSCMRRIGDIRRSLQHVLFGKLISRYQGCHEKKMNLEKIDAKMHESFPEIVRLVPYAFIVTDTESRESLARMACSAWMKGLGSLSSKTSFTEKDVDFLLGLKSMAPDMPNLAVRRAMDGVLTNLFMFILKDVEKGADKIPAEKIAILAQWLDDLKFIKDVDDKLREVHEAWKEANKGTTASVISDQSGADDALIQPESEKSSTAKSKLPAPPTAEASAAKVSKTSVVFPAGWENIEKDESLQFCQEN